MTPLVVHHINIYPLTIRLRGKVSHATAERGVADPVIVRVEMSGGVEGWGETLPRHYVTGESVESVTRTIHDDLAPALLGFRADSLGEALEAIEALPWTDARGVSMPAARSGVETALLDASLRAFDRSLEDVVGWMGLPGFGAPGSARTIRYSGVLAAGSTERTLRQLRLMRLYRLRDFKLKVGTDGDAERLRAIVRLLRRHLPKGTVTVRLDANGAWELDEAMAWLHEQSDVGFTIIEQPLSRGQEDQLPDLKRATGRPIMHDESLITRDDAQRLVDLGVADAFNIRISKCGGVLPALRLAALAKRNGVDIQLGCMVGETALLSTAHARLLAVCPGVKWAEGCFDGFLLQRDIGRRRVRFRWGGRPPRVSAGPGLTCAVDRTALAELAASQPMMISL